MTRQSKKQIENQSQSGRSMVEMLGVLAIIGVLSLGGIAGYRMAMNHYQANQIAHEINLMRTDAKVKIAQGMTKLLLGSPYDGDGHLNFNANYGVQVDFPITITDDTGENEEVGYSFTLSNIPAGVCKPLATLLDGMDDTVFLEINGDDYATTENLCGKDKNEIEVAFSAENSGDDDSVPEECPKGTTLSEDGSECTCAENEKTCNGGCCAGCTGGKVWNGKKCVCPAGAKSGKGGEECVCSGTNPYWDGTKCTTCPTGSQPLNGKCVCSNDPSKEWKASAEDGACNEERFGECEDNADCGPDEYCYLYFGKDCYNEFDPNKFGVGRSDTKSECRNVHDDIKGGKAGNNSGFIFAEADVNSGYMTGWSAERFCKALGRSRPTRKSIGCGSVPSGSSCYSEMRMKLTADFTSGYVFLAEKYDNACYVYSINVGSGAVVHGSNNPGNGGTALCE